MNFQVFTSLGGDPKLSTVTDQMTSSPSKCPTVGHNREIRPHKPGLLGTNGSSLNIGHHGHELLGPSKDSQLSWSSSDIGPPTPGILIKDNSTPQKGSSVLSLENSKPTPKPLWNSLFLKDTERSLSLHFLEPHKSSTLEDYLAELGEEDCSEYLW